MQFFSALFGASSSAARATRHSPTRLPTTKVVNAIQRPSNSRVGSASSGILLLFMAGSAIAQTPTGMRFDPPHVSVVDKNGVSLISGLPEVEISPVSIGPDGNGLALQQKYTGGFLFPSSDSAVGKVWSRRQNDNSPYQVVVEALGSSETFDFSSGGYVSANQGGGSLSDLGGGSFRYVDRNGTTYDFDRATQGTCPTLPPVPGNVCIGWLKKATSATGIITTVTWSPTVDRPTLITRSDGWALSYQWASSGMYQLMRVTAINLAVDYCDKATGTCSTSRAWPVASFDWQGALDNFCTPGSTASLLLTDKQARVSRYTHTCRGGVVPGTTYWRLSGVRPPTSVNQDTLTYTYFSPYVCVPTSNRLGWDCSPLREGIVKTAVGTETWTYSYEQLVPGAPEYTNLHGLWTTTSAAAHGYWGKAKYNSLTGVISSVDTLTGSVGYQSYPNRAEIGRDEIGRIFKVEYDARGNITAKTQYDKNNVAVATMRAGFDAVCSSPAKCNKPNWTKDAEGNQTDYTYDAVHGGILTETSPADIKGIRAQKRYSYVQRYPWLKNASGGYSRADSPIWLLDKVSYCISGNAHASGTGCALGATDEVVTSRDYGPDAGPTNLLLRGEVVSSSSMTTQRRTCFSYDVYGNKISQTTPNAALASCP